MSDMMTNEDSARLFPELGAQALCAVRAASKDDADNAARRRGEGERAAQEEGGPQNHHNR